VTVLETIIMHLPALQIAVPLIAAPICILLPGIYLSWFWTRFITVIVFAMSIGLAWQVHQTGVISYELGGWAAPWGIEYRVDRLNAFVLLIVSTIGMMVVPFAFRSVQKEIPDDRHHLFYAAFLLCLTGLLGIAITGDAFNVFVFLEISSLSSYALIAMGRDPRALTAAFQYLVMGTIGATFILIGIGLMYQMTGTLNMADLARRLPAVAETRPVMAAFAFFTVGVCLKLALFPLHMWLPGAYAFAPSVVTAFIAATATKVSIYVLLRFFFTIFGVEFSFDVLPLTGVLVILSVMAIVAASTSAIFQKNVKRLLAYSSVAQIGYIVLGISLVTVTGLTSGLLHMFNHALMKGALFLAMGAVYYRVGSVELEAMRGVGRQMPLTMFAFVIAGLSLIGVPMTVGFISKWYLLTALFQMGWWPIAVLVLASSLLAVVYIWKVVEVAYFQPPLPDAKPVSEVTFSMLMPIWVLTGANVYFGIDTRLPVGLAGDAARQMLVTGG
jgi:multicomponent Na+:H+ antiporter subunit D